jgi:hypothetical protein
MLVALPEAVPPEPTGTVAVLGDADDGLGGHGVAVGRTAPTALPQTLTGAATATAVVLPDAVSPPAISSAWAAPADSSTNPALATVMPRRYFNRCRIS